MTIVNWIVGIAQGGRLERSRTLLAAIVATNLGALVVFKYLGLLDESARGLAGALGLAATWPVVHIVLPIGLSFFTFEFIHYQVDLFRGHPPIRDPLRFALFPAFFPTQIAGPIKRFQDFNRQVALLPRFDPALALEGVELIALGLFKKVVLADNLLPVADAVFRHPQSVGTLDAWAGLIAFSFQIYMDFSGYTDIGRGSAQLLGYTVPINFRSPYLASSLRDFWRRWHISLSSWLRDYLYIPLGGSHKSEARTRLNLMITMCLGGLWHGAAWHFLFWGAGHGGILAVERFAASHGLQIPTVPRWARVGLAWIGTQVAVLALWSLFRAENLGLAATLWSKALTLAPPAGLPVATALVPIVALGVLIAEFAPYRLKPRLLVLAAVPAPLGSATYIVALGAAAAYSVVVNGSTHSFIYFQF